MKKQNTPAVKKSFNIGDRVKCDPPCPALHACIHGQVVYYHSKTHDPLNPRVRWASGWGTNMKANELVLLTPVECDVLPAVMLVDCDIKTT
jgi:hypothetical protein